MHFFLFLPGGETCFKSTWFGNKMFWIIVREIEREKPNV